ncbi:hypothetical protein B0H12DRAFT_1122586 [Mycena haematopus]|nr:hypothetical protein B0H12DRAFT_1122586 [Mycena haematopus]
MAGCPETLQADNLTACFHRHTVSIFNFHYAKERTGSLLRIGRIGRCDEYGDPQHDAPPWRAAQ